MIRSILLAVLAVSVSGCAQSKAFTDSTCDASESSCAILTPRWGLDAVRDNRAQAWYLEMALGVETECTFLLSWNYESTRNHAVLGAFIDVGEGLISVGQAGPYEMASVSAGALPAPRGSDGTFVYEWSVQGEGKTIRMTVFGADLADVKGPYYDGPMGFEWTCEGTSELLQLKGSTDVEVWEAGYMDGGYGAAARPIMPVHYWATIQKEGRLEFVSGDGDVLLQAVTRRTGEANSTVRLESSQQSSTWNLGGMTSIDHWAPPGNHVLHVEHFGASAADRLIGILGTFHPCSVALAPDEAAACPR